MNLLNPGVYALSVYNETDNVLAPISGSDISPSSTLEKTVLTRGMSSLGNVTQLNYKWELNLQLASDEAYTVLKDLNNNSDTALEIVKLRGFVTWRNLTAVHVSEAVITDPESEDYPYSLTMTFIGPDPYIRENRNYLAPWKGVEERPWTITGDYSSASFDGTTQTITTNASGSITISTIVYAPFRSSSIDLGFEGVYRLGVNIDTLPTNANLSFEETGTNIAGNQTTTSTQNITTTGAKDLLIGVPYTNGAFFTISFVISNLTEVTTFEFSNPYIFLGLNGYQLTEFVNY